MRTLSILIIALSIASLAMVQDEEISLASITPDHYNYAVPQRCISCKGELFDLHQRVVGIVLDPESNTVELNPAGWMASAHAVSQSSGRINSECAWCHAPFTKGAQRVDATPEEIPAGNWRGVDCLACHPSSVPAEERKSTLSNFVPGMDANSAQSYVFRNSDNSAELNAQCRFCHHVSHDIIEPTMDQLFKDNELRCIDCHMAAYQEGPQGITERFHNMKVEANLPHSCGSDLGTAIGCHSDKSKQWMLEQIPNVKGPIKEW